MQDYEEIIEDIKEDSYLRSLWEVYLSENKYITDLTFDKVVDVVTILSNRINEMQFNRHCLANCGQENIKY